MTLLAIIHLLVLLPLDSDGGPLWLLVLLGPAGGAGFYLFFYFRYRNSNKTNQFERETAVAVSPMQRQDQKVDFVHRTKRSEIPSRNDGKPRERVQRIQL